MKIRNSMLCNLGRLTFLFFLVKGLAWILLPVLLAWWAGSPPRSPQP